MADLQAKLDAAKAALVAAAQDYADRASKDGWRELCRAKATIDTFRRMGAD